MPKSYISMLTALHDFTPDQSSSDTGLLIKEGQLLLLLDASNDEWWRVEIKTDRQNNANSSGFAPKEYMKETNFIAVATACNDYVARIGGDLTITEHEALLVYCVEEDWALVMSPYQWATGYVPRARIQLGQELDQAIVLFDYEATNPDELSVKQGETLIVLNRNNEEWWYCANAGYEIGLVPYNYVELHKNSKLGSSTTKELAFTAIEEYAFIATEDDTTSSQVTLISSHMGVCEVMSSLVDHGCTDLTSTINLSTFGEHPVSYGEFGDVYRGRLTDDTLIAVKTLRIPRDNASWASEPLIDAARELHTWGKCCHPNILPLLGLGLFRGRIGMVSPWQREGRLPLYLERTQGVNRYNLSVQICEGLAYLHQIGIIHGDLRASNILVSHDGVPLLFDFGNSWLLANQTMSFTRTGRGLPMSLRWAAPELIEETNPHDEKSDVYALGMTLYEVITSQLPYYGKSDVLVILLVVQKREPPERPDSIPEGHETMDRVWGLFLRCWAFESKARPSATDVAEDMKALRAAEVLSTKMVAREVISHLVAHGCQDLSGELDLSSFGEYPVSHGGLSDIYRGLRLDGGQVAVKVLRVSADSISQGSKHLKHAARELHTWSRCSHPNIMPLLGLAVFRDRIGMVAYWMKHGNLPEYLKMMPGVNRYSMCLQICDGLSYLHKIRIVHCDLKGANVLVSDEGTPLLTDFGTSLVSDRTLRFTATTGGLSCTLRWSAAEILQQTNPHTEASDVYALGMTIYETISGEIPYHGKNEYNVIRLVTLEKELPERPSCIPVGDEKADMLWKLLTQCWSYEPEARPSASQVATAMKEFV
ncbi:tyrosine kinase family catalytic domain protein [Rhizoctonia solani AG-3 Rhs1AP]|uniref:mitogen-activated protein kinase kinase kinase n=2 Tax=Rhizoctonia solani AG-3 TaxID=1086053 RepID=A0A074RRM1_9AGAM|nr:tyrosine kinase family catalytic domain protein [Rhizoctonia solani AG-3 Rhs1AP]KEP49701.1 tyrosine kinase family catalytic domain protein [Rhizoctonia solani 123E]